MDASTAAQRDLAHAIWAGVLTGLVGALLLVCLQMAFTFRDRTYLWYGLYMLAVGIVAVVYSGVAQKFLWPNATKFASDALPYSVLMAFAFNLLFVQSLFGKWLSPRYRWVVNGLIAACIAFAVKTVFTIEYAQDVPAFIVITVAVSAFIAYIGLQAMRKRVPYSGFWLIVYVPYLAGMTLAIFEILGQVNMPWVSVDTPMLLISAEAVAMMLCLNAYSRERNAQAVREQDAMQRDPLTGFLNQSHFLDLATNSWRRAARTGRDISVAYVLVESKESDLSTVQSEALMMRSVRMVRTAMRENDAVGRIGRNMLGIAMPDAAPGDALDARLARLVALGLMADPRDRGAIAVKFTVAVGSWRVNSESFSAVDQQLRALLTSNNEERPRTIRFLSPA